MPVPTKPRHLIDRIEIKGAHQNNLKHIDLTLPLGSFTVVTGVSGSGKSSLVFETLYAEGQRQYIETFSPYARQFLERLPHPKVQSLTGVPPAIAIDQNDTIKTTRSTVGTMSEVNDYLKLLFANHGTLFCPHDGQEIACFSAGHIVEDIQKKAQIFDPNGKLYVQFEVHAPLSYSEEDIRAHLSSQGFTKIAHIDTFETHRVYHVIADRFKVQRLETARLTNAVETALDKGHGQVQVLVIDSDEASHTLGRYGNRRQCPNCQRTFKAAQPNLFSFNSPIGACESCKGFGRVMEFDLQKAIPDPTKSVFEGAIVPLTKPSAQTIAGELTQALKLQGISIYKAIEDYSDEEMAFLLHGRVLNTLAPNRWQGLYHWYHSLEKAMHKVSNRILLAHYRKYVTCPSCLGSHLKPDALHWRIGQAPLQSLTRALHPSADNELSEQAYAQQPGLNIHEMMLMPIDELQKFFNDFAHQNTNPATELLIREITARLNYLVNVGLGYLTLDRQSRTLSGGEVQRLHLTSALGTNLVNTLFVLDEPSIGLHPRDMSRINQILKNLHQSGNTLVVVEHDPQVMLCGQRLVDLGPAAGAQGGQIIFNDTVEAIFDAKTPTADYLSGRRRIDRTPKSEDQLQSFISFKHCTHNNLKDIEVRFPLNALSVVCGISGSGKSSLIADTVVPLLTQTTETQQHHVYPRPDQCFDETIFMDQATIGATSRATIASYLDVFTWMREVFLAKAHQSHPLQSLDLGLFSFNSPVGRCPTCEGSGLESIDLQFMAEVQLPCPDCQGQRYNKKALSVYVTLDDQNTYNISDVLNLTVEQALQAFKSHEAICRRLQILELVGLEYLTLQQSLSSLSGGERQRLKLAKKLVEGLTQSSRSQQKRFCFIFDEPTTGLHFSDIEKLIHVFNTLIQLGHTVIVIEHNLDVIHCADWIVELGPEGGHLGGHLVFEGSVKALRQQQTYTAQYLNAWEAVLDNPKAHLSFFDFHKDSVPSEKVPANALLSNANPNTHAIEIFGAREHNLKNINLSIPRDQLTVITGPSGSGKSTLAFDILFAEGQRRFLSTINAYARTMVQPPPAPDVDLIRGIPPTVALEQRTTRGGQRSTVGTITSIYHYLRLIYLALGVQYCPSCQVPTKQNSLEDIVTQLSAQCHAHKQTLLLTPLVVEKKGFHQDTLEMIQQNFKGAVIDGQLYDTHTLTGLTLERYKSHTIYGLIQTIEPQASLEKDVYHENLSQRIQDFFHAYPQSSLGVVSYDHTTHALEQALKTTHFYNCTQGCPQCARSFMQSDPRLFSFNSPLGQCPTCLGTGVVTQTQKTLVDGKEVEETIQMPCPECENSRLNVNVRNIRWHGYGIGELGNMFMTDLLNHIEGLTLSSREQAIVGDALIEIKERLRLIIDMGLDYLSLNRSAPTLSGGEMQRLRLASQLRSTMSGVCYILDEPTIGLHSSDNTKLLNAIEKLATRGNTVLIVEHDEETIRKADHIIEIGPHAGAFGGEVVVTGSLSDLLKSPTSVTAQYLRHPIVHRPDQLLPITADTPRLTFKKIRFNTLNIDELQLPLGRLIAITGISGSGKSTLCREIIYKNLHRVDTAIEPIGCESIEGQHGIGFVTEVDQTPIGHTPRSCPATYLDIFTPIRNLFAQTPDAQSKGFSASRFSFNLTKGNCPTCGGQGMINLEMSFLSDVKILCEACKGSRFNEETLSVKWKGLSIADVLELRIDEAVQIFEPFPKIVTSLKLMQDVGLGYLKLGQHSPTLSGGEAQRLKLVSELAKAVTATAKTKLKPRLYILDEPTVGLHMSDVHKLAHVMKALVKYGHTVVVIEHNLDLIAQADWIIDMGPQGGAKGGQIVGQGTAFELQHQNTLTGQCLKAFLNRHPSQH